MNEKAVFIAHPVLPVVYFTVETAFLSLYSDLFGIRNDCSGKIRAMARRLDGRQANPALSSIPQGWL